MKNFIRKDNYWYRIQQFVILALHLVLLKWLYYVLTNSSIFSASEVLYHAIGTAILGAALIRGCAYWARYHYFKRLKEKYSHEEQIKT